MENAIYKTMEEFGPPFLAAGATMLINKMTVGNVGMIAAMVVVGLFWVNYKNGKSKDTTKDKK